MGHRVSLIEGRVEALTTVVTRLTKRKAAKRTRIHGSGSIPVGIASDLVDQRDTDAQLTQETQRQRKATLRCGICREPGYNRRVCPQLTQSIDQLIDQPIDQAIEQVVEPREGS